MKEIDLSAWERKEHFDFFSRSDLPFYNTNFNIDIIGLKEFTDKNNISLSNALIFSTVTAMSSVKNFLYRIENDKVFEYDRIDPSFTYLKDGEELFRLITVEHKKNLYEFDKEAKKAISESKQYFDLSLLSKRSNFVFISILPWIPFTGIDHTMSLNKNDSIPRVSWGKCFEENNKVLLPFNIQVNHRLIDGIHVGKFYNNLIEIIDKMMHS